jgi:hypothetical protein
VAKPAARPLIGAATMAVSRSDFPFERLAEARLKHGFGQPFCYFFMLFEGKPARASPK